MMKIILLAPSLESGGAERQLVVLANALAHRGHDVAVALFRVQGVLLEELEPTVSVLDLKKQGRTDLFGVLFRLRNVVKREDPDVLYSFLGVPNLATLIVKLLGPRIPVVWSIRASDMDLGQYDWLSRACSTLEAWLSRFADCIVANSKAGQQHSLMQGFHAKAMSVVFNGIDTGRFKPDDPSGISLRQQLCPKQERILVGIVARLDPMKDHRTFLQSARQAISGNPNLCFVCVGDGPLATELKQMAENLGLSEAVVWAGAHRDMPAIYNALDILCLSSSFGEGFPNVLGEAMSCGVPCITTDVGDAAHIVGDTGLVVPKKNPEAMAKAMLEMAERVRRDDASGTRTRIEKYFYLERMVIETERILREVLR